MKNPFFSIIIPTYNRAALLKIAVNSVFTQTFSDFELIIIDDGSEDNTKEMIETFQKDYDLLHYINQGHKGVSSARNTGINNANGEFICFLDSDDRFRKEKLQITYRYIKNYPQYKIFHTEEIWYRNGQILPQKIYHKKPTGSVFKKAVGICCISISTAAIHRDIFNGIGLFDETLAACEDYDFWLRTTAKFPVYLIPQYLTIKEGGHPGQQSKKYAAMDKFRIYALTKILASGSLSAENYKTALAELKKKCYIYMSGAEKRGKFKEIAHYKSVIAKFEEKCLSYRKKY